MNNYPYLLEQYKVLWNNRRLESNETAEDVLKEAIQRDLNDENTHPRARRTVSEKYVLATKRIIESNLEPDLKMILIRLHLELYEKIREWGNENVR